MARITTVIPLGEEVIWQVSFGAGRSKTAPLFLVVKHRGAVLFERRLKREGPENGLASCVVSASDFPGTGRYPARLDTRKPRRTHRNRSFRFQITP